MRMTLLNREMLRLALPNILSNLSVPLLATVDVAIMGRLSALHIGAVGLGAMLFSFIFWNFGFLRMGTIGLTAQAYGRRSPQEWTTVLYRSLVLALLIGGLLLLCGALLREAGFFLLSVQPDSYALVKTYFDTLILCAPATLLLFAFNGWFFGMQNAWIPLMLTVVVNVVNIVLGYCFVFNLGMEIAGVAMATVIAQYTGCLAGAVILFFGWRRRLTWVPLRDLYAGDAFRAFFRINGDLFLRTVCLSGAFAFFYARSSESGPALLAVNVVLLQFLNWMSYGIDGFAYAAESMVGRYTGSADRQAFLKAVDLAFRWGTVLAFGYAAVYWLAGTEILRLFTPDADLIELAEDYLGWFVLLPLAGFAAYIWDGVFIGLADSRNMRNTMLWSLLAYIPALYLLPYWLGNHGAWAALCIFLGMRGILLSRRFAANYRQRTGRFTA